MRLWFEHRSEPLLSRRRFLLRVLIFLGVAALMDLLLIGVGTIGFRCLEPLSWMQAALDATMLITGNGPARPMQTDAGRIMQMAYAVVGGLFFVLVISVLLAPVMHRVLHAFRVEPENLTDGNGDAQEDNRPEA